MKRFGLDPDKCHECYDCAICEEELPHIFYAGDCVMNQPETEKEEAKCLEIMESCPAKAIYEVE